ncbi:hypothetical protein T4B_10451 [Trichinella pseudospiralis]|uniref:Uncharacterized protein n=1 Tax=Trichinella pseudospiralis TaxID=6337 RepID=A0A0V1G7B2_TRIPS|nr:hypothetical protein T4B_10451 [Trichinella pseudospiralis]
MSVFTLSSKRNLWGIYSITTSLFSLKLSKRQ